MPKGAIPVNTGDEMKPMETIQDLIEEAKLRTVWWGLCIFCVTYFLSRKLLNIISHFVAEVGIHRAL